MLIQFKIITMKIKIITIKVTDVCLKTFQVATMALNLRDFFALHCFARIQFSPFCVHTFTIFSENEYELPESGHAGNCLSPVLKDHLVQLLFTCGPWNSDIQLFRLNI